MAVIAVLFLVNLDSIKTAFSNSKFLEILETRKTDTTDKPAPVSSPDAQPLVSAPAVSAPNAAAPVQDGSPGNATGSEGQGTGVNATPDTATGTAAGTAAGLSPAKTRAVSLFFVRIEDDGVITRQEVKRAVAVSDSPLADALNALLAGPTEDELRRKLISLVPRGTRLLGVGIRGSTATIDLSDAFMYNRYGIEGYAGQLKQIVYTATSFPGIQDVQILIEGKTREYLGGEGVFIGKPISRNSF